MRARLLVAVIGIPVLFAVIYLCPPLVFTVLVALFSALGSREALWSTGFSKRTVLTAGSMLFAVFLPFWIYFQGSLLQIGIALYLFLLLLFGEALLHHKDTTPEQLGGAFLFSVLTSFGLSALIYLNQQPNGKVFVLLPFLASFLSDAGGLFTGMIAGRHKLAPELSPKKTVEGAIGGVIYAMIGMVLYGLLLQYRFGFTVSYPALIVYGLLGSMISQMGDLSFSFVKRHFGIKDYGALFPGHGGVLDRFDSVIFSAPLFVFLIHVFPVITG